MNKEQKTGDRLTQEQMDRFRLWKAQLLLNLRKDPVVYKWAKKVLAKSPRILCVPK